MMALMASTLRPCSWHQELIFLFMFFEKLQSQQKYILQSPNNDKTTSFLCGILWTEVVEKKRTGQCHKYNMNRWDIFKTNHKSVFLLVILYRYTICLSIRYFLIQSHIVKVLSSVFSSSFARSSSVVGMAFFTLFKHL